MEPMLSPQHEDLPGLVMENELLRYEVTHLRARVESYDLEMRAIEQAREATATASTSSSAEPGERPGPPARRVGDAEVDLVWLLERLESSPAARLLRRRPRYRTLLERYLGAEPHDG